MKNFNALVGVGKVGAMFFVLLAFCFALAGDVPFNGASSGNYAFTSQTTATVDSYGHATIVGPFRSHEDLTINATGGVTGEIDWMAADGSVMTAQVNGQFTSATSVEGTYTVTGGTGRFEGAAGTANFVANITGPDTVGASFSGTLSSH
jgi:hypothetical protein